jgi:hypothetical protein
MADLQPLNIKQLYQTGKHAVPNRTPRQHHINEHHLNPTNTEQAPSQKISFHVVIPSWEQP